MKFVGGRVLVFAAFSVAVTPQLLVAQECPWFTRGSAEKLLGGEVKASIQGTDDKGSCSFSREDGKASHLLEIVISAEESGACPQGREAVRGIGNEAFLCRVRQSATESVERVSSRVRDKFLTVTLTSSGPRGTVPSDDAQREILDRAAESVAGNLF